MLKYATFGIMALIFFGCNEREQLSTNSNLVRAILADAETLAANFDAELEKQDSLQFKLLKESERFATNAATAEELLDTIYNNSYYLNIIASYLSKYAQRTDANLGDISSKLLDELKRLLKFLPAAKARAILNRKIEGHSFFQTMLDNRRSTFFSEFLLWLNDNYEISYTSLTNEQLGILFQILSGSKVARHHESIAAIDKKLAPTNTIDNFVLWSVAGGHEVDFNSLYKNVGNERKKILRKLKFKEQMRLAKDAALASASDGSQVPKLVWVQELTDSLRSHASEIVMDDFGREVSLLTYAIGLLKGPEFKDPRIKALISKIVFGARGLMSKAEWQVFAKDALAIAEGLEGLNDINEARILFKWNEKGALE